MIDARHIYCGQCEARVRPKRQWKIASIEPPHFGGTSAALLSFRHRPIGDESNTANDISIRQYVRDGETVKEDEEREFFASRFPLTESQELEKQNRTQMKYLFTDTSEVRIGYYLLATDENKMIVLRCPYCRFQKKLKLQFIREQYQKVLDVGGRLVLSSSGLDVREGGQRVRRADSRAENH